ncbi:hypothetical protein [Erwinia billingiae]|jgi:hypothetical protein|uniref:hypothetical protein n=1 Tax=Erwinia billingiae TaxID=182337 RepID=UPI0008FF9462|nr:hypothetical protein [Erwinia billingiae]
MTEVGTIVQRHKRKHTMVVLEYENGIALCGWIDKGRFYKRRFPVTHLKVCAPWSNFWPFT